MQYKTPESASLAKSQESLQLPKSYNPSARAPSDFETRLGEQATAAQQSMKEMGRDMVDRARKTATATDDYVRAQPWKAIGIGAVIGVVLGLMFARR